MRTCGAVRCGAMRCGAVWCEAKHVEIVGDSMINNINDGGISRGGNVKLRKYPRCTTDDLKVNIEPTAKKCPDVIIIHSGTNGITNGIDTVNNLSTIINRIKRRSPNSTIAITSIVTRKDRPNFDKKVSELNTNIKEFCKENLIVYICNDSITESCLGAKKLHLNKKGCAYLANNFITYIKNVNNA